MDYPIKLQFINQKCNRLLFLFIIFHATAFYINFDIKLQR